MDGYARGCIVPVVLHPDRCLAVSSDHLLIRSRRGNYDTAGGDAKILLLVRRFTTPEIPLWLNFGNPLVAQRRRFDLVAVC
jgi:hypothetical protein